MKRVTLWLICLTIFLLPSNLFLKLGSSRAFVHGLFVDYLIPKLYLSDLPIFALLLIWGRQFLVNVMPGSDPASSSELDKYSKAKKQSSSKNSILFLLLILSFTLRQLFTENVVASIWFFSKLVEWSLFSYFAWQHRNLFKQKIVTVTAIITLLFQSLLGFYQYTQQVSFFPSYRFLGEVRFSQFAGLEHDALFRSERILPYGTTAHPNILAGVLTVFLLILFARSKRTDSRSLLLSASVTLPALVTLFLTQSFSAWATFLIGACVLFAFKRLPKISLQLNKVSNTFLLSIFAAGIIFIPLFIHFSGTQWPTETSLTRRSVLTTTAIEMFQHNSVFGIGLNQFTVQLERFTNESEVLRFVQPAHNVFWLWIAETGVLGAFIACILVWRSRHILFIPLLIFLPILTLDHYLLTQQTGALLFIFFVMMWESKNLQAK